jgi:ADP-ribosylglycohydrolase
MFTAIVISFICGAICGAIGHAYRAAIKAKAAEELKKVETKIGI